ncbi:MAG: TPM domain-containing protein [Mucilaginibacter sp.]|uniref:TPM domain-containing protein n=1 Tax=Mucilaginibacter sp. TaxID=1882438 RepID=UPI0032677BD7
MALFTDEEQERIRQAIVQVEENTSGEVRVCVEKSCSEDVLLRAAKYFESLDMEKTEQRHGVLIYLATADRKFAIIGDKGINSVVAVDFWDTTKNAMLEHFKNGDLIEGIVVGLRIAGEQLQKYFPNGDNKNPNQLPDDVAFMDGD